VCIYYFHLLPLAEFKHEFSRITRIPKAFGTNFFLIRAAESAEHGFSGINQN